MSKKLYLAFFLIAFSFSANAKKCNALTREAQLVLHAHKNVPRSVIRDLETIILNLDTKGQLPKKYISKAKACALKWSHKYCKSQPGPCNLKSIAKGKKIGGDRYQSPKISMLYKYREADLGDILPNECRNSYRIIYSDDFRRIYFTKDHYKNFLLVR